MQNIVFPSHDSSEIVQPPSDPAPGQFYNDEVEGLIWIPEDYDTGGEALKIIVTDKDTSIILEDVNEEKTAALAVAWMGFITEDQEKKIAGSIEVPLANIQELQAMGEINRILVITDDGVRIFPNTELISTESPVEEMMPVSIQFIATDDLVLKKDSLEETLFMAPVEGVGVVDI